jgi:mannose-6-phosphate isomerase
MGATMVIDAPCRLTPRLKEVVWGGDWLVRELGRPGDPGAPYGESWEAYAGSVIADGPATGRTLGDLFAEQGEALFGAAAARFPRFPLLVKFIDAHQNLSVQVHPDDAGAQRLESYPYGKTEYWYVLEAEPEAQLIYGLNRADISREELQAALRDQTLLAHCARVTVRAGDVLFIPAGTVHALTAGVVVYELQQDCDITYRLYDWGRTGREIHLEKGLECIDTSCHTMQVSHPELIDEGPLQRVTLAECDLFRSDLVRASAETLLTAVPYTFLLLTVIAGAGAISNLRVRTGDTLFLPANTGYRLSPDGSLTVIESRVVR